MTVAGQFRAPTVQRREADPNKELRRFGLELEIAKTERSDLQLIADGISKGIDTASSIQKLQSAELDMRQKELNLEITKQAQEELIEQKKQERQLLEDISTGTEAEQLAAIDGLPGQYGPQVIENMNAAILMRIRKLGNSDSPMTRDVVNNDLLPRFDSKVREARMNQQMKLEQIDRQGEASVAAARARQTGGVSSRAQDRADRAEQRQIAAAEEKRRAAEQKRQTELRNRDYTIASEELRVRFTKRSRLGDEFELDERAFNAAVANLGKKRLEIDRLAAQSKDGTIVLRGRKMTIPEADAAAINSVLGPGTRGGGLRSQTSGITGDTAAQLAPEAPATTAPARPVPPASIDVPAPGGLRASPVPQPIGTPAPEQGTIVTPGGQELPAEDFERLVEQQLQGEIDRRRQAGQTIAAENIPRLREIVRQRLLRQIDEPIPEPQP